MLHIEKFLLLLQRVFHGIRLLRLIKRLVVVRQSIFFVTTKRSEYFLINSILFHEKRESLRTPFLVCLE